MAQFDLYTAEIEGWAKVAEVACEIPEHGERTLNIDVEEGAALVVVLSEPNGFQSNNPEFSGVEVRIVSPDERVIDNVITENGQYLFADDSALPGTWTLSVSSAGEAPFSLNVVSYKEPEEGSPIAVAAASGRGGPPWKCRACKMVAKALALAIAAGLGMLAVPAAVIAAVAKFLGIVIVMATAFIQSLLGDSADIIATKLCRRLGLC